jgi:hypothetical protein
MHTQAAAEEDGDRTPPMLVAELAELANLGLLGFVQSDGSTTPRQHLRKPRDHRQDARRNRTHRTSRQWDANCEGFRQAHRSLASVVGEPKFHLWVSVNVKDDACRRVGVGALMRDLGDLHPWNRINGFA